LLHVHIFVLVRLVVSVKKDFQTSMFVNNYLVTNSEVGYTVYALALSSLNSVVSCENASLVKA